MVSYVDIVGVKAFYRSDGKIQINYAFQEIKAGKKGERINQTVVMAAIRNGTAIPMMSAETAGRLGLRPGIPLNEQGVEMRDLPPP